MKKIADYICKHKTLIIITFIILLILSFIFDANVIGKYFFTLQKMCFYSKIEMLKVGNILW